MIDDSIREQRRRFIGSSDLPAILGICPWRSPRNIWEAKVLGKDKPAGRKADWGTVLEAPIATTAAVDLSEKHYGGRRIELIHPTEMYVHENGIFAANLDRECVDVEEPFVFEAKAVLGKKPYDHPHYEMVNGNRVLVSWGRSGSDAQSSIPLAVFVQVQWQMLVRGFSLAWVGCFRGWMSEPLGLWRVPADPATQEVITDRALAFWHDHVLTKIPPAIEDKSLTGETVEEHNLQEVASA